MWVTSKRQFSLNQDVQFDKRMVNEKIPREVPDDEITAAFIDPGNKPERPLKLVKDDAAALKQLRAFVRKLKKEQEAVIAKRKELAENGSYVAFEELQKTIVPKIPEFYELAVEPEREVEKLEEIPE